MTILYVTIGDGWIVAEEIYCGDDIKYVEGFDTWDQLLKTLGKYFHEYASVVVRLSKSLEE